MVSPIPDDAERMLQTFKLCGRREHRAFEIAKLKDPAGPLQRDSL